MVGISPRGRGEPLKMKSDFDQVDVVVATLRSAKFRSAIKASEISDLAGDPAIAASAPGGAIPASPTSRHVRGADQEIKDNR